MISNSNFEVRNHDKVFSVELIKEDGIIKAQVNQIKNRHSGKRETPYKINLFSDNNQCLYLIKPKGA